jgi:hypothetical protein
MKHRIYVGRLDCGCIVAASLEADGVLAMAKRGLKIETVDAEYVEVGLCRCSSVEHDPEKVVSSP